MLDQKEKNNLLKKIFDLSGVANIYLDQVIRYLDFLIKKNLELNLISRKLDINTIINDHIFDCLIGQKYFTAYDSITDLGSGGGLPGILLAIIFPRKKIILIDKSPKKCIFLNKAVDYLRINNAVVINNEITKHKIISDVVTCRAFKPVNVIIQMTENFFNNNGTYVLYKGRKDKIDEELAITRKKYNLNTAFYKINEIEDKERHIVVLTRSI